MTSTAGTFPRSAAIAFPTANREMRSASFVYAFAAAAAYVRGRFADRSGKRIRAGCNRTTGDINRRTFFPESNGNSLADAATGTCYDGDLA